MTFNSLEFFVFISIVLLAYCFVVDRRTLRDVFLLIASYAFYSVWYWQYAGLILLSTIVDYFVGLQLGKTKAPAHRRLLLIISLATNLGLLGFFKYANFFSLAAADTASLFGWDVHWLRYDILLPVGISFYTFQTLSYTIDVYRKTLEPESRFLKFAVFVSFFPQLVAGPIVRAADFLPQLRTRIEIKNDEFKRGLILVFWGLFKKIVIADSLALLGVDAVFLHPDEYSSTALLAALYAYAFQIYCDFSGYSDIAIGLALMMGFRLPVNFNRPYLSRQPSEFWHRWHITLSTWLRDYLYIPLGGGRGSNVAVSRNLMVTMALGGLWHGAAWHFVMWGIYHGILLIINRPFRTLVREDQSHLLKSTQIFITFHLVLIGWLLFRIHDMSALNVFVTRVLTFSDGRGLSALFYAVLCSAAFMHFVPVAKSRDLAFAGLMRLSNPALGLCMASLLVFFAGLSVSTPQFIYFQF